MRDFCSIRGCPEMAVGRSDYCEKHQSQKASERADQSRDDRIAYGHFARRARMMGLVEVICADCGKPDFIKPCELIRRSRPRCKHCGSVALDVRRKVATESMARHRRVKSSRFAV
jgi:hypothetical protein